MYRVATRNVAVFFPRCCSLAHYTPSLFPIFTSFAPSRFLRINGCVKNVSSYTDKKVSRGSSRATKKPKIPNNVLDDKDLPHILWWKERLQMCRKFSTVQLIERLEFSNLLGLNSNLKNGSLKEGTLNWEMLQFKSKFPRQVLLCRVGEFYEAWGIDACILVEYVGLNPIGGLRSDSIPRASCPVVNLRQTLDDLTTNGYSVCIVEEAQGPSQARSRKRRFISGHAHPGNPYVYGLATVDHDLNFPEPMPVVGISHSARGYCINMVLETMKTYSSEDCLTEEAVVTKLRTCQYHYLFLHTSLRRNSCGTCNWGEFGEGGLLWGECSSRHFDWFDGNPVSDLLAKVKELYSIDDEVTFRNTTVSSGHRARPLTLGTSTQIGAIPTEGIPSLLKVLLPSNCNGLPVLYIRELLLNPPSYEIASKIQATCKLMSSVTCSIPEFTCVSSAKLVKLLEWREVNHMEFCRIKNVLDEILQMYSTSELNEILKHLIEPTWVATGLEIDFETLVAGCEIASSKIGEIVSLDDENDQKINSFSFIPHEFFEDMESKWKGRIKRIHIDDVFTAVEKAAEALHIAVTEDFVPVVSRIKAIVAPLGGPKGEISYAREQEAVWFKGKRFTPNLWAGSPGEEQIKQLRHALDSKGRKVGEEWFTTPKVEAALTRYHEANAKAKERVLEILRGLAAELQYSINILVFSSMLLVIAKALFAHASEGRRRRWVFPTLVESHGFEDVKSLDKTHGMKISGLLPYWFHIAEGVVRNDVDMQSLFLLTGPNGGGKSSFLRSICAAALLGICGLMVPAESALIPYFDSITLHMKSYDSPADKKSSFQVEMSELRSIIGGTTNRSLVLVDEICRGTETAKGTCIAGSIIETLDGIGCLGIVSTHLHGIFTLPLNKKNTVHKAMGTTSIDGQIMPTWKLTDGVCKESLAFETAKREGIPEHIVRRAEYLYQLVYAKEMLFAENFPNEEKFSTCINVNNLNGTHLHSKRFLSGANQMEVLREEVERAVTVICQDHIKDLKCKKIALELTEIKCLIIGTRELPPPSVVGSSSVYVMFRPDKKLYVGETDDLEGRVRRHRLKEGMHDASFLYFLVPGKSLACQFESLLINQLSGQGFQLSNIADGKHRNFGTSNLYT
ncbi:DNA mismatch repair protein [Glycine max]|uniref:DNA mismatch repair protein n=1 Tax=Glycine max TaxID=3847 RepID=Q1XBQ8_SOYBN|nr:DNA mismatch repair protein [Glycine max]AAX53095.1 DNA mismatch repair protein [Glycine max]|eukprot:NP_001238217.1 DNA mismatch repair protein [Glycine max]